MNTILKPAKKVDYQGTGAERVQEVTKEWAKTDADTISPTFEAIPVLRLTKAYTERGETQKKSSKPKPKKK